MSNSAIRMLQPTMRSAVQSWPAAYQADFGRTYSRRKKSTLVAYFLWILFGFHYIYIGRVGVQIFFWLTGGGFLLWWLIDFFRIPGIISRQNEEIAEDVFMKLQATVSGAAIMSQSKQSKALTGRPAGPGSW